MTDHQVGKGNLIPLHATEELQCLRHPSSIASPLPSSCHACKKTGQTSEANHEHGRLQHHLAVMSSVAVCVTSYVHSVVPEPYGGE